MQKIICFSINTFPNDYRTFLVEWSVSHEYVGLVLEHVQKSFKIQLIWYWDKMLIDGKQNSRHNIEICFSHLPDEFSNKTICHQNLSYNRCRPSIVWRLTMCKGVDSLFCTLAFSLYNIQFWSQVIAKKNLWQRLYCAPYRKVMQTTPKLKIIWCWRKAWTYENYLAATRQRSTCHWLHRDIYQHRKMMLAADLFSTNYQFLTQSTILGQNWYWQKIPLSDRTPHTIIIMILR